MENADIKVAAEMNKTCSKRSPNFDYNRTATVIQLEYDIEEDKKY